MPGKNTILKKISIALLPSVFWLLLAALGFGAQSLSNLIELLVILILSLLCAFIPERLMKFKYLIIVLFVIVFLVRLFTPIIPE